MKHLTWFRKDTPTFRIVHYDGVWVIQRRYKWRFWRGYTKWITWDRNRQNKEECVDYIAYTLMRENFCSDVVNVSCEELIRK